MEDTIKIVGERKEFSYDEIKESVVRIGGKIKDGKRIGGRWYWRSSDKLTYVGGRYYRKNSPLIKRLEDGSYVLKSEIIEVLAEKTRSGDYHTVETHKGSKHYVIDASGRYIHVDFARKAPNGKYYHRDDLIKCKSTANYIFPGEEVISLSEKYYSKNNRMMLKASVIKNPVVILRNGHVVDARDSSFLINEDGSITREHYSEIQEGHSVIIGFENPNYPKSPVYASCSPSNMEALLKSKKLKSYSFVDDKYNESKIFHSCVDENQIKAYNHFMFDEKVELPVSEEPKSSTARNDLEKFVNGGRHIYGRPINTISRTFHQTGGLDYSFGVEIELGKGSGLTAEEAEKVGIACYSDGSISGNEFVTGVLHGDTGIEQLKKQFELIQKYGFVDDTCGLHVHIGGIKGFTRPSFDRNFSMYAIKLGTQVEEELFQTQPPTRNPFNKYCASIRSYGLDLINKNWAQDYRDINHKNAKDRIAEYVYAVPHFSIDVNRRSEVSRWNKGRYKWLNLTHCNSSSRFTTIEFRMFAGTTHLEKVLNYVRLSMAFTHFVDNGRAIIDRGDVTLEEVLMYSLDKDIAIEVLSFLEGRKSRFNRSNIYEGEIDLSNLIIKI